MKPTSTLDADQLFFFEHAGYGYDPKSETPEQGRTRGAIKLAAAEALYLRAYKVADVEIRWEDEPDPDLSWLQEGDTVETCEQAAIFSGEEVLAALGNITDANSNYRRVIRAELAVECEGTLREIVYRVGAAQS